MYSNRAALLKALSYLDGGGVKEGDLLFEVGNAAFSTTSTTLVIVTGLNKMTAGFAVPFDSYSPGATNAEVAYQTYVRPDIAEDTNSHLKTFTIFRSSKDAVSGLKVCYTVFGRVYDTAANT